MEVLINKIKARPESYVCADDAGSINASNSESNDNSDPDIGGSCNAFSKHTSIS